MSYATLAQLVERYGLQELADLLCDEQQLVTDELLKAHLDEDVTDWSDDEQAVIAIAALRAANALAQQTALIDSKISTRYLLPLTSPASLPVVECCLALTRAALADDGDNLSTTIKEERKHWRTWLDQVASGDAVLPGETAIGTGGAAHRRHTGTMQSGINWESY